MKRIFLTGVTGIIGMALVEESLKHGVDIYAIVRPGFSNKNITG